MYTYDDFDDVQEAINKIRSEFAVNKLNNILDTVKYNEYSKEYHGSNGLYLINKKQAHVKHSTNMQRHQINQMGYYFINNNKDQ